MKQQLPTEEITYLQSLHADDDRQALYNRACALRSQGWTLAAIATPLKVSRTTVSNWESKGESTPQNVDSPLPSPQPAEPKLYKIKIPRNLSAKESEELSSLYEKARKRTRHTPTQAPEFTASTKINSLLHYYHRTRKISLSTLANHLNVTRRAISQRITQSEV